MSGSRKKDTSSFPLLDFNFKAELEDVEDLEGQNLLEADDALFMKSLKDVKVVQRKKRDGSGEQASSSLLADP